MADTLITPIRDPVPAPLTNHLRYDWPSAADGQFHQWRDADPGEDPVESVRAYRRLRKSARQWAMRRGGTIETRSTNHGRQVWIAIHLPKESR
jgi:hypothetical protein